MISEKCLKQIDVLNRIITNAVKLYMNTGDFKKYITNNYYMVIDREGIYIRNDSSISFQLFLREECNVSDDFITVDECQYYSLLYTKSYGLSLYTPNFKTMITSLQTKNIKNIDITTDEEIFQNSLLYNKVELNSLYLYNCLLSNTLLDAFGLRVNFEVLNDIDKILGRI